MNNTQAPTQEVNGFEARLREALKLTFEQLGITQKEAAKMMRVSETSLSRFMSENQKATQRMILAARTIFNISLDELIPVPVAS